MIRPLNGGVPNYGHKIIRAYCKTIIVTLFPIHDLEKNDLPTYNNPGGPLLFALCSVDAHKNL